MRIGVTGDIHSMAPDGSDTPAGLFTAFEGVDRIVACGDHCTAGALRRLRDVAPVTATVNPDADDDGGDEATDDIATFDAGGRRFGVVFSPIQLGARVNDQGDVTWGPGPLEAAIDKRFGERIDVLLVGGTHQPLIAVAGGILVVNPGSPRFAARTTAAVVEVDSEAGFVSATIIDV
jgi:putative phosphoesterase